MKILKIAQGGDNIIIRLRTDKRTGEFSATVLGHTGASSCGDGLDDDLIRDLLEAEIPGFGNMAEIQDSGKTSEAFQGQAKPAKPQAVKPEEEEEEESFMRTPGGKNKLDLGYGV